MLHLAQAMDNQEYIYDTYGFRLQEFMEIGDMTAFEADHNLVRPLTLKLKQPFYNYYPALIPVALAICTGHFAEAEQAAQAALEIGRQMHVENVDGVYGMQMFSIRREQGRLPELAPLFRLLGRQHTAAAWRPGLALLYRELEMYSEAQQEFEALAANDFASLPHDAMWITTIAYLAEVCTYLNDKVRAAILYEYLLPYDGRTIVVGFLSVCYGAVARYLGILAATLAWWPEAEDHFEAALALNAEIGARPWLAHTQHQYALMRLARNSEIDDDQACRLLNEALTTAQELGMHALVEKIKALQKASCDLAHF
jgi:tetratricopeptide (TPR) repeat protein